MYPPAPSKQREHWPVHPGSLLYIKGWHFLLSSMSGLSHKPLKSGSRKLNLSRFRNPIPCQRFNVAVAQVGLYTPQKVHMVHPEIYGLPFLQRKIIFQFNMLRFSVKIFGGYLEDHLEILFLTRVESVCLGPFNNILDPRWILFTDPRWILHWLVSMWPHWCWCLGTQGSTGRSRADLGNPTVG